MQSGTLTKAGRPVVSATAAPLATGPVGRWGPAASHRSLSSRRPAPRAARVRALPRRQAPSFGYTGPPAPQLCPAMVWATPQAPCTVTGSGVMGARPGLGDVVPP